MTKHHLGFLGLFTWLSWALAVQAQGSLPWQDEYLDGTPPQHLVKLIFIHHSTGENWLADDNGGLGLALAANNYYVSDTHYGWGRNSIGDRTDIPDWPEWFAGVSTHLYLADLSAESGQHSPYSRWATDSGRRNQVILFKSCFPNSALEGQPDDSPDAQPGLTVGHAKYVYNLILGYFGLRPDKLFVVITAPPLSDDSHGANARAFNEWLRNDWLQDAGYPYANVAVFDFYNLLTDPDAHHRLVAGREEHQMGASDLLAYPSAPDDDHPSQAGNLKATEEFVPLLNGFYHRWVSHHP